MVMSATVNAPSADHAMRYRDVRKATAAAVIGTVLEWYDFIVYAYLSTVLAKIFFPSDNPTNSLLAALAVFGVGYFGRPLGSILFGWYGDKFGRKATLVVTMIMMAVTTGLMALLPTYQSVGILAPLLLVVLRILQGVSVGGESSAAFVYIVELAPANRRGFASSFHQSATGIGLLLGSLCVALLTTILTADQVQAWGWRIPFAIGVIIGPIGTWMRKSSEETPSFAALAARDAQKADQSATSDVEFSFWRLSVKAFLFGIHWNVAYYTFLSYMPLFAQTQMGLKGSAPFWVNSFALFLYSIATPFFGLLSDVIGRKKVLLMSCFSFIIGCYPLFLVLVGQPPFSTYVGIVALFAIFLALWSGAAPATIAEQFPTRYRSRLAIGYSMATIFGGFTPFINASLIDVLKNPLAPTFYVTICAMLGALVTFSMTETAFSKLRS
jgi:MHS family proline/betaine transporter-like MFS transporter